MVWIFLFVCLRLVFPGVASAYVPTIWQQSGSEGHLWSVLSGGSAGSPVNDIIHAYAADRTHRSVFLVEEWGEVDTTEPVEVSPQPANFEASFYLYPLQGYDRDFVWHYLDEDNFYQLHFSGAAGEVTRTFDGDLLFTASKNLNLQLGEEYLLQVRVVDGKVEVWLEDELIISAIDWTYSLYPAGSTDLTENHRFGFRLAPGTIVPVENEFRGLEVIPIAGGGGINLPVPFYRQDDVLWGGLEYDHAKNWSSNPTMTRWGCAVTSAAMVFNFHGLENLPDGQNLNPQTLNLWLKSQLDGYVGNGYLNWLALTRLSREIHEAFPEKNLPKFEFSRFSLGGGGEQKLQDLLGQNIPVIGNVPGHFLVIMGFESGVRVGQEYERGPWAQIWDDRISWVVNDPFFEVEKLGPHPNGFLKSVRVFAPSQTDQSYWLFEHSADVILKIVDKSGAEILVEMETVELHEDGGEEKQTLTTSWVEKPASGEYFLEVVGDSDLSVKFWSYSQEAEVSLFEVDEGVVFNFNYSQEFSWAEFLVKLEQAWEVGEIDGESKYLKLKELAEYALENPSQRYLDLVERFLTYNASNETKSWLLGRTS